MKLKLIWNILIILLFSFYFNPPTVNADWSTYRVSPNSAVPSYPQLAVSDSGYAVVWVDDRISNSDLYFAPINIIAGKIIQVGKEQRITNNAVHDLTPALVWNGHDFGIFWSYDKSSIYFSRINKHGKKIVNDISIGVKSKGYAIHVSAVWNGQEYGVTWWDVRDAPACTPPGTRGRAFFARVDIEGRMIGEEIPVSDAFSNPWQDYKPLIVWDGENYAIFWGDSRENGECAGGVGDIYMAIVNRNGEKILGDIKLQSNELSPQLWDVEWDGENYAIGYNGRIGQADLAKMDINGNTILVDVPINSTGQGGYPMITSYDNKYYLAWNDFRDRTPETFYNNEIYYTSTDKDGNKLIPETRLTFYDQPSTEQTPIMFYKGNMGIAWIDSKDSTPQVYFASNLANYPKLSKPQKPPKPSISIPRPIRPLH